MSVQPQNTKTHLSCIGLRTCLMLCLMLGFAAKAQESGALDDFTLQDLMNMEMVSSSKFKQDLSEVTASAYVITAEDIKLSGATELPQLLKMVPGLYIAEASSSSWAMGIRGFNSVFSNKMLVMIDGRSLFSPLFSGVFWEQLDLFIPDIERIEVIRGVGSTVWGANAVNGIINIITKSTLDNESSQLYVNSGNHIKYDAGLRFGSQIADQSYVRLYLKSKDIKANRYVKQDGFIDDSWRSNTIGVKWEHFAGRDSFVLSSDLIAQSIKDPGLITSRMPTKTVPLNNENLNVSFQWQRQMSTDKAFTLSSQIQQNERDSVYYRIDDHMFNVDFDTNYKWQDHQILVGFGARQHDIDFSPGSGFATSERIATSETQARILSAYIQDEWRIDEFNAVIFGTKFESHKHTHKASSFDYQADLWLPTIRFRHDVSENSRFWAAVSRSARVPSVSEHIVQIPVLTRQPNAQLPLPYEVFTSGNASFDKEKLMSFELGFRANIDSKNSIDVVAYHNDYDDVRGFILQPATCIVSGQPYPDCVQQDRIEQYNTFENLGELSINGFEISWLSRLSESLNLSSNYAYLTQSGLTPFQGEGYEMSLSMVAKHQVSTQLDWHASEQLDIRFKHQYVSGIDDSKFPALLATKDFRDHYHSVDITGVYELSPDKNLTLSVTNLLQQNGRVWAPEFPDAHVSEMERRVSLGVDVKF